MKSAYAQTKNLIIYIENWWVRILKQRTYILRTIRTIVHFPRVMRNQSLNKIMLSVFRARMICLWLAGMSAREISCCTGASISTVYRWVRRWQAGGSVEAKHSRGRQPERIVDEYFNLEASGYLQGLASTSVLCEMYEHSPCRTEVLSASLFGYHVPLCICNTSTFPPLFKREMQTESAAEFQ